MKTWKLLAGAGALLATVSSCDLGTSPTVSGGGTEVNGLSGTVVDFRGAPVSHAWIRVFPDSLLGLPKSAAAQAAVRDSVRTDAQGRYRLILPPGTYALLGVAVRNDTVLSVLVRGIVRTEVRQNLGLIVLQLGGSISLQVKAGGAPLANASCTVNGLSGYATLSDGSGTCTLANLPEGNFRVTIAYPGLGSIVSEVIQVNAGQVASGGQVAFATDSGPAPVKPTPWSPNTNSVIAGPLATLAWLHPDSGSVTFRLQVAQDSTFAVPVLDTTLTGLNHAFDMEAATTYYWRVSAMNAHGSSGYAPTWRFSRSGAPLTAPAAPALVGPNPDALVQDSAVLLWTSSPTATSYHVQLASDSTFGTLLREDSALTVVRLSVIGLTGGGARYHWRVRAKNAVGAGAFSSPRSFRMDGPGSGTLAPPLLSSPADDGFAGEGVVPLTWSARAGANGYRVQAGTDSLFASLLRDTVIVGTSFSLSTVSGTRYYWRVGARDNSGWSLFSETRTFVAGTLGTPLLVAPAASAANVAAPPSLVWNSALGATAYEVQVSTVSTFTTLAYRDSNRLATSLTVPVTLNENEIHHWRVRSRNGAALGTWSESRSFTLAGWGGDTGKPAVPALIAPADGATEVSRLPTLAWNPTSRATSYHVQLATNASMTAFRLNDSAVVATTRAAPALSGGTPYYWRVRGKNGAGFGEWSNIFTFVTESSDSTGAP